MDLSIVTINYKTPKLTKECVDSVIKHTKGIKYEVILIDNNSDDGSLEIIKKLSEKNKLISLISNESNLGFAKANNQGLKVAKGRYVLFLNSDTLVKSNLLKEMVEWMDKKENIGVATCALKNPDGSMQGTGGYFPTLPRVFTWMTIQDLPFVDHLVKPFHPMKEKSMKKGDSFYERSRELDWVTGAFFLIRKKTMDNVGGFDEDYFMYTEEVDLCYRIKNMGSIVWYNPKWSILHYGGASGDISNSVLREYDGVKMFYRKHYASWKYPILRLLLKVGALLRMVAFGVINGSESLKIYGKAFITA